MTSALVAALGLVLGLQPDREFRPPEAWTRSIEPFAIAERLYWVGSADLAAYLLTSDAGHILIDAPMEENVALVLGNIRKLGFDPADIEIQLASHGHFDHTGGMASMLEQTGAELLLSAEAATLVGNGGKGDFHLGDRAAYAPAGAAGTIRHLEEVRLGDLRLTAHLTPGHTKGCTSWSGEVAIEGEAQTLVSICSLSVLDGYRLVGDDPSYPGIGVDFCRSVTHLRSLQPDIFLASHGSFIGLAKKMEALAAGDRRAFVDPDGYRAYLDSAQTAIERTLAEQGHEGGCAALMATP